MSQLRSCLPLVIGELYGGEPYGGRALDLHSVQTRLGIPVLKVPSGLFSLPRGPAEPRTAELLQLATRQEVMDDLLCPQSN